MQGRSWLALLILGLLGCQSGPIVVTHPIAPVASHNYLVHLPGMAGWIQADTNLVQGLADTGVADHCEIYDWTHPHWMIGAVWAYDHNRAEAQHIADRIAATLRAQPDAKIILTAWSAGGALALWTLEDLPEGVQVQSVLLVEPAVDPDHDLTRALKHIRGHLFATQSGGDCIMLGIGTIIFGTTDGGAHVPAAGNVGFQKPVNVVAEDYAKYVPIPYQYDWIKYGNYGGHAGPLGRKFASDILARSLANDVNQQIPLVENAKN